MSIGYHDVRAWDAKALDTAAKNLRGRRDKLTGLQDELDDARRLPDWKGAAGEGARNSLGTTRNKAEIMVAELSAVERALQHASDDVTTLKTRVANNDSLAATYQFRIADNGSLVDDKPADPPPTSRYEAEDRAETARHRATIKTQVEQETAAILTAAKNIDTALALVMKLAQDSKISDHGATTLAAAEKGGVLDAKVAEMEQSLRDAGLLTGPPVSGKYRQWLENAVNRGVSIDTIKKMVSDHKIKPEDFAILDRLEEIREDKDGDGIYKSFFLLPTDLSGADAAKAVQMTYVLNAGTDYGPGGDFAPTPYGSDELRRIIERQGKNDWSYKEDVSFVHGNGGRLVTTPNGMLMGLGGNFIQDQFSQNGGTAWGDIFMLNIDDPKDPAQQLRDVAKSGSAWYDGDKGPYEGNLDLDRLLHHEERHSQQWAREGYTKFLASYLWEQATGGNETEEDAGLSDGGY
ncbi:WXG100 family type VII secretion target [Yinghuangia soli]|uniref:Uncharacterized protein n=1 Tax=Yinghuangia soli TaxID=2908204 RepID=A0AA41Q301_9ACTN|nr:hypothetical protein [Yinghuangia soli]MCF2530030.1 hypothetical protein [Yinghuangia soli]